MKPLFIECNLIFNLSRPWPRIVGQSSSRFVVLFQLYLLDRALFVVYENRWPEWCTGHWRWPQKLGKLNDLNENAIFIFRSTQKNKKEKSLFSKVVCIAINCRFGNFYFWMSMVGVEMAEEFSNANIIFIKYYFHWIFLWNSLKELLFAKSLFDLD